MNTHTFFNWPTDVFEIRPPASAVDVLRYNNGLWTPDDGEWDLAFVCLREVAVFGVDIPYYLNFQWKFLTGHWNTSVAAHPRANPWHHIFSEGNLLDRAQMYKERSKHPNVIARDAGMSYCSKRRGCAGGVVADFNPANPFIAEDRIRLRGTTPPIVPPLDAACVYCGCKMSEAQKVKA